MAAPILCLHGLMGAPELWSQTAPAGADLHSFPGHGGRPPEGAPTLEAFAADLADRIAAPAIILATSMGAAAALILAAWRPECVARLILTGATPCLAARADFPHALPATAVDRLAAGLKADFNGACRAFCTNMAGGDLEARDRLLEAALKADPEFAAAALADSADRDLRPLLASVTAPATVIAAADDRVTPHAAQAELAGALGADLVTLSGGGHGAYLTRPDAFRAALDAALGH
ncbi:MAG: alpha/beta hydrolase [Oceanicaulis sp.]